MRAIKSQLWITIEDKKSQYTKNIKIMQYQISMCKNSKNCATSPKLQHFYQIYRPLQFLVIKEKRHVYRF